MFDKFIDMVKNIYNKEVKENQKVLVGRDYYLTRNKGNPFGEGACRVHVKDVKDGWVLYAMNPPSHIFQNESKKEEEFLSI